MKRNLIIALLLCMFLPLVTPLVEARDGARILFVGNSYTGQIERVLTEMIESSPQGKSATIEFIAPGGKTLEFHLQNESTIRKIEEGDWDFVVLQDQSQTPAVFPDRFEDAAIKLDKVIAATGARTVFYQTWGRRDGDKQNATRFPDYESMQKALSDSYRSAARRCKAILAPVGDTWSLVRSSDAGLGAALYKGDGSHPSIKGAYLAASVFYSIIFEQSPAALEFKAGLSDQEADVILKSVKQTTGR